MRVLDLFSGIGGFSLGFSWAGFRTVAFCEIDPFCRAVLARHWPGVPIYEDIHDLDGTMFAGTIDVVCGGYPCQPFSCAGNRCGESDPRHLWPEMDRVLRGARPRWVVCENVRGHVSKGFDAVAASLEDDGYEVWPFLVPACAVGAPHRRERLWIVAHHSGDGRGSWRSGRPAPGGPGSGKQSFPTVDDTDGQGFSFAGGSREAAGTDAAAVATFDRDRWWEIEPDVGRMVDGFPGWVDRLRSLGNAVVPQIPFLIACAIRKEEGGTAAGT